MDIDDPRLQAQNIPADFNPEEAENLEDVGS